MAILSIGLVTVWRGFGGQGRAIDDGNTYFSIFLPPPPNRSDKEWQLCTTEGPAPVFKCLGGREGPLMAEIYIFCFPIFFPNMSGISDHLAIIWSILWCTCNCHWYLAGFLMTRPPRDTFSCVGASTETCFAVPSSLMLLLGVAGCSALCFSSLPLLRVAGTD